MLPPQGVDQVCFQLLLSLPRIPKLKKTKAMLPAALSPSGSVVPKIVRQHFTTFSDDGLLLRALCRRMAFSAKGSSTGFLATSFSESTMDSVS